MKSESNISSFFYFFPIWYFVNVLYAQSFLLPPVYSDTDYILRLNFPPSKGFSFRHERYYVIENNIIPLSEAEKDVYEPKRIEAAQPYYDQYQLKRYSFAHSNWQLEYGDGTITSITGNTDAAQLWVDVKSKNTDPTRLYFPFVQERRTYAKWWRLEYEAPWKANDAYKGVWTIGLRYLDCHRFREWTFRGTFLQNRLMGDMVLLSTRGIDFFAPSGHGLTLDFIATINYKQNWRGLIAVEGLWGKVSWEKLRRLDAQVDTGAFAQDPDGFIHNLPSLWGKETYISLEGRVQPQLIMGLSRRQAHNWWLGTLYTERINYPNLHFFALRSFKQNKFLLFDVQFPTGEMNIGYAGRGFGLFIGLTNPNPKDGTSVNVQSYISF